MGQFDKNLDTIVNKRIQTWKKNQKELEKTHNKVWVPLVKYVEQLEGVSNDYKQRMLSSLYTIRKLDTDRILRLIYEHDVDEDWNIEVKIYKCITKVSCQPTTPP
jgi:hypothetical protein